MRRPDLNAFDLAIVEDVLRTSFQNAGPKATRDQIDTSVAAAMSAIVELDDRGFLIAGPASRRRIEATIEREGRVRGIITKLATAMNSS